MRDLWLLRKRTLQNRYAFRAIARTRERYPEIGTVFEDEVGEVDEEARARNRFDLALPLLPEQVMQTPM